MRYVLARGESGLLYLYEKRTWEYLQRDMTFADTHILTEVAEGDDGGSRSEATDDAGEDEEDLGRGAIKGRGGKVEAVAKGTEEQREK